MSVTLIKRYFASSVGHFTFYILFCMLGLVQEPSSQVEETGEREEGEHIAATRLKGRCHETQ